MTPSAGYRHIVRYVSRVGRAISYYRASERAHAIEHKRYEMALETVLTYHIISNQVAGVYHRGRYSVV